MKKTLRSLLREKASASLRGNPKPEALIAAANVLEVLHRTRTHVMRFKMEPLEGAEKVLEKMFASGDKPS